MRQTVVYVGPEGRTRKYELREGAVPPERFTTPAGREFVLVRESAEADRATAHAMAVAS